MDRLAKKALKAAHCTGKFIESSFPNEQLWITMGGRKVTGSLRNELEDFWGRSTAKKFFHKKRIVSLANFNSVWWLGYEWAIFGNPKTFCIFIKNRYLDGVDITPSSCFGKRQSSTGVHNADAKMRLQNTSPDAPTWVACFNFMIQ